MDFNLQRYGHLQIVFKEIEMSLDSQRRALPPDALSESSHPPAWNLDHAHVRGLQAVNDKKLLHLCATFKDSLPDMNQLNGLAGKIDVFLLAPSRWAGRDVDTCIHDDDDDPETQLSGVDPDSVPLLIRPWPAGVAPPANFPMVRYEVLAGTRRLMARLRSEESNNAARTGSSSNPVSGVDELMPEVLISAVLLALDDKQAARVLIQANQGHKPLRPFQWGGISRQLLNDGVFKTQKEIARVMNRRESEICRGLALFDLDPVVLGAFHSPLELQYTDGPELQKAWKDDAEGLSRRAEVATRQQQQRQLDRMAVLAILLGKSDDEKKIKVSPTEHEIWIKGLLYFVVSTSAKGVTKVKAERQHLLPAALALWIRTLEAMGADDQGHLFKPE